MSDAEPKLVIVTGWAGAGKSTIASAVAAEIGATIASFDWLMSGLRSIPDLWALVELPVERQREIGWSLLSRVAEQQLRRGASCVLDLVAREVARKQWEVLAKQYGARFHVIECICSDSVTHRARLEGRQRNIPGWYELTWADGLRGRQNYIPLENPKLVLDAVDEIAQNIARANAFISGQFSN